MNNTTPETDRATSIVLLSHHIPTVSLFLYSNGVDKYHYFSQYIHQGIRQSEHCLYAYYHTKLRSALQSDIAAKRISVLELRDSIDELPQVIDHICDGTNEGQGTRCVFDFSRIDDFRSIVKVKQQILEMQDAGVPISVLLALDTSSMTSAETSEIVWGIPHITIMTANETVVSLRPEPRNTPRIDVADRTVVEDVVKKLLEPLILSYLTRPVSGYDILRGINERFHVIIPMARVYSYLYDLEKKEYLETRTEGRSKVYSATRAGEEYIHHRKQEIHAILKHVFENE